MPTPSICLSMIVKDEVDVIERCLRSVERFIDHWVIVDTGSSDGTQMRIRQLLSNVPGELFERPWKNFGHNRSEALALARRRSEYLLVIDADERLDAQPGFQMPRLTVDAYQLLTRLEGTEYYRTQIVRDVFEWRYEGVLHEYITCDAKYTEARLPGLVNLPAADGSRSRDPDKYTKDAEVLEAALEDDPDNARYVFYLAQSYRDAGSLDRALNAYRKRASMGGFAEEVWYSLYQVGLLQERLGRPLAEVVQSLLMAYQARPSRAEPLCTLASLYRTREEFALAHLFASQARCMVRPDDILFVDEATYAWRSLDEYAIAAYWVGEYEQAFEANRRLLEGGSLPPDQRARVAQNQEFCRSRRLPACARDASRARRKKRRRRP
jgi:glycosyltransferase involved in cell wall biosynthesis